MQVFGVSKIETTELKARDAVGISEIKDFEIEVSRGFSTPIYRGSCNF